MTNHRLSELEQQMVTGWKVRDHGRPLDAIAPQGDFTGFLIRAPSIGLSMWVLRLPQGDTLITSPVQGVFVDADGSFRVETQNSTYRLVPSRERPEIYQAA